MLSTLMKQYLSNLKRIWIPFLVFTLTLLIAFLLSYFGIRSSMQDFALSTDNKITTDILGQFVTDKVNSLKFDENLPIAMNNMFSFSWLKNTLSEFDSYVKNMATDNAEFEAYNEVYRANMLLFIRFSFIIIIVGIFLTNFLTSFFIYRANVKKKLSQTIFGKIIDTLLVSTVLSLTLGLTSMYHFSSLISFGVLLLMTTLLYLLKAYLVFGRRTMKMKSAIKPKNIFLAITGEVIVFLIGFGIVAPIYFLLGALPSILVWIPLYIYTESVIHTSFDYYIVNFTEQ